MNTRSPIGRPLALVLVLNSVAVAVLGLGLVKQDWARPALVIAVELILLVAMGVISSILHTEAARVKADVERS